MLALLAFACGEGDKNVTVPAYLSIQNLELKDSLTGAPLLDTDIRDVWCFVDGKSVGVFGLPARIPVPFSGKKEIRLYAGVWADGQADQKVNYPFYAGYIDTIDLVAGSTKAIVPKVKGTSAAFITSLFKETFEASGIEMDSFPNGGVPVRIGTENPPTGGGLRYGLVRNQATGVPKRLEITQTRAIKTPSKVFYAELQYKSNTPITIGLYGYATGQRIPSAGANELVLSASGGAWRKVYVFLANEAEQIKNSPECRVFIRANSTGLTDEYFAIDNLNLISNR